MLSDFKGVSVFDLNAETRAAAASRTSGVLPLEHATGVPGQDQEAARARGPEAARRDVVRADERASRSRSVSGRLLDRDGAGHRGHRRSSSIPDWPDESMRRPW